MIISIIIPVYNVEDYLRDCLDSVLAQTCSNYEVVCVNDGSKDNSLLILEEYAEKFPRFKIINQENKGLSGARNAGILAATGDYVFLLDSDDWLEPQTIEVLIQSIFDEDFIAFNGRRYFEDGRVEEPDPGITENRLNGWDYYNKYALVSRKFHFLCSVLRLYRRQFLLDNQLFFKEGIYHEDNLFTPLVCYYAKSVKVIQNCFYVYRIRKGSITQNIKLQNVIDMVIVANSLSEFFISKNEIEKKQLYRDIAGKYLRVLYPDLVTLCGNQHKEIRKLINMHYFSHSCVYKRHKRLFSLYKTSFSLFTIYLNLENFGKKLLNN